MNKKITSNTVVSSEDRDARNKIQHFKDVLGKYGIDRDFEPSFKMKKGLLLHHRLLTEIPVSQITDNALFGLCDELQMPQNCRNSIEKRLTGANGIGFSFEEDEKGEVIYKVYLEYWDKLVAELPGKINKFEPELLHVGYKWTPSEAEGNIDDYYCFPLLAPKHILNKISHLYQDCPDSIMHENVASVILVASSRVSDDSFIYLEVNDAENDRYSFDVNLTKANLKLADIFPHITSMGQHYLLDDEVLADLCDGYKGRRLSHLAGGINRAGEDFITVYLDS